MVLLDTGTPGTSREIFSEDADDRKRGVASVRVPSLAPYQVTA